MLKGPLIDPAPPDWVVKSIRRHLGDEAAEFSLLDYPARMDYMRKARNLANNIRTRHLYA
jgi:hypothetical protein